MRNSILLLTSITLALLSSVLLTTAAETEPLKVGDIAPDFTLKEAGGEKHTLYKQLQQGKVALLFYRSGAF